MATLIPFDGKQSGWGMWAIKFKSRATICGYRDVLEGKTSVPKESEDLSSGKPEDILARKKNQIAYSELLLSMQDTTCITAVADATTKYLPSGDAEVAWEKNQGHL